MRHCSRAAKTVSALVVTALVVQGCKSRSDSSLQSESGSSPGANWLMDEDNEAVRKIKECAHKSEDLSEVGKETAEIGAIIIHAAAPVGWNPAGWIMLAVGGLVELAAAGTGIAAAVQRCGALDIDLAGYQGDWSLSRIKRSCPKGRPVVGTRHEGGNPTNLDINCGEKQFEFSGAGPDYRYVENGYQEKRWGYALDCGDDEYLAGISYGVTTLYGIKSVLCAKLPAGSGDKSCHYLGDNTQECSDGEYLKGMWVQRAFRDRGKIGVFVDTRGRQDDLAEYGDQIKGVSCCSY
jgi:hypothetical protein